jgi:hypothetical protein
MMVWPNGVSGSVILNMDMLPVVPGGSRMRIEEAEA